MCVMENDLLEQLGFNRENRNCVSRALSDSATTSSEDKFGIRPLVDLIVKQATSDKKYGSNAGKLCSIFVENESNFSGESRFRNILLTKLQREYTKLKTGKDGETRVRHWLAFVAFLSSIFHHIRIQGEPLHALVVPVLECLNTLISATSDTGTKQEAIQCVVMQLQLYGKELENLNEDKMAELFCAIREVFLSMGITQFSRLMLLEIIELRACGWTLSNSANQYYYSDMNEKG